MEYLCPERTRKKYVPIGNECLTKGFNTIFDNYSTYMFGIFMIFWILCLRRLWQRYLARFQYQWSACKYSHWIEKKKRHKLKTFQRCWWTSTWNNTFFIPDSITWDNHQSNQWYRRTIYFVFDHILLSIIILCCYVNISRSFNVKYYSYVIHSFEIIHNI